MITILVAVDNNWGIGKNNKLLFKLPNDMQQFKNQTIRNIVVMGYNTLLSLPRSKPLANRLNIVLCPEGVEPDGCVVYHDFNKLVNDLKLMSNILENEVYICGGAMLYKSLLPYCDRALVTKVHKNAEADTYFPNLDQSTYKLTYESEPVMDNGYKTTLCYYYNQEIKEVI